MRLHVVLPDESAAMPVSQLVELAQEAEALGFAGVWLPDHVLPPAEYGPVYGGVYEPLMTLAHVAAATSRVTLGTSVLILPLREPILLAKQAATLAHLSGDRFVLGVGVGWQPYEFEAVGADFAERGAITTAALQLIRRLHTGAGGPYADNHYAFDERAVFQPVPATPVPLLIGGNSDAALRRAALVGDMWQGVGLTPAQFATRRDRLRELGGDKVSAGTRDTWNDDAQSIDDVVERIREWAEVGPDDLGLHFGPVEGFGRRMRALAARLPELHSDGAGR
ncbi:TIGR03619 family F420-dependent LLM class oxidoreductase [Nocardia transvalensis]|uniref:TIGR03619 family F420-dependent LLM class oxidoreductase n=1 Tax=Nocardia transvalensis TaxID=37333 RepID=UPI001896256F|nr:TIGR03619 family F420-dependent LLM class oxidoreductase [Nocardia transvalensis]MBF6333118.1 TIGR03619 family F420-dependent LLM class oxidoreductase [Nocardia transvalensis]